MPVDLSRGRHANAAPPRSASLWKCVSCGAENAGPLEQGCAHCGSGRPGEHVGVPPPPVRTSTAVPRSTGSAEEAFLAWRKRAHPGFDEKVDPVLAQTFYETFLAGWQAALTQVVQPDLPLAGTAESRTVIAALRLWIENALPNLAEEIANGEYLGRDAIETLISKLERSHG